MTPEKELYYEGSKEWTYFDEEGNVLGPTDAQLVERTRNGDRDAYSDLVTRYQGHVYGLAYSLAGRWEDAQDIAQETFIRAYMNLDQLRDPTKYAAWLRRITFGVGMKWLKAFRPKIFELLDGRIDLDTLEIPDFRPGPPEIAEKRELARAVHRALESVPAKYRIPLTMFHLDGLSYEKVADFLDIPLGTAKSLISRARTKLKAALGDYYGEEISPMVQEVFNEHKLKPEFAKKVLEGVPQLGWGKQRECTFIGALEAAVAPTERPFAYADMMGWSGLASRTRWFTGNERQRWCGSSAVGEMEEEIATVAKATGWPLRVEFVQPDDETAMTRLTADFVASIDAARPLLAYEPRLNMDVVFGYEDGGKTLLLRDYFQPDTPLKLTPAGLGFLVLFIDEPTTPMAPRDALVRALRIAVQNWHREKFAEGPGSYWYGEVALTHWKDDLEEADQLSPEEKAQLCFVSRWNYTSMHDARQAAVTFLHSNAPLLPDDTHQALTRAAELYEKEENLLSSAFARGDAFPTSADNWSVEMRTREREILAHACQIENEAVSLFERVLTRL